MQSRDSCTCVLSGRYNVIFSTSILSELYFGVSHLRHDRIGYKTVHHCYKFISLPLTSLKIIHKVVAQFNCFKQKTVYINHTDTENL